MIGLCTYAAQAAVGLAGLIRSHEVTAAEVEDAARRASAAVDPQLSATVVELYAQPLGASNDGPFTGVPFAMKITPTPTHRRNP